MNVMKTTYIFCFLASCFFGLAAHAQNTLTTAAVANPSVSGLPYSSETVAKMLRVELRKTGFYQVYDEFDMREVMTDSTAYMRDCYGVNCLSDLGSSLNVNYIVCGSFDKLTDRIVIQLKVIDIKTRSISNSIMREFVIEPEMLQRMITLTLCDMYQLPFDASVASLLVFNNNPVIKEAYKRINNSGPRMGVAFMHGSIAEFATRPEEQGGLDIAPFTSLLGYQLEAQYIGTENFSALVECIFNVSGLEQGNFVPSVDLLNGFRFGTAGWELGFGPGFSAVPFSLGFFDTQNSFGKGEGYYFSEKDWETYSIENFGSVVSVSELNPQYSFSKHFDKRGDTELNTFWIFAFGRTFHSGSLNIPVNAYYTIMDEGGYAGLSFGFNVVRK